MKSVYLAVANKIHFWVMKYRIACSCLKIKIYRKRDTSLVFKIVLIINDLPIIKELCSTNWKMFLHSYITFGKIILAIVTLPDFSIAYSLFSLIRPAYIAFVCSADMNSKITYNWFSFIKSRLVNYVNRFKI